MGAGVAVGPYGVDVNVEVGVNVGVFVNVIVGGTVGVFVGVIDMIGVFV